MTGVIYIIKNKVNDKVYIGQTIQPLIERWYRHCAKSKTHNGECNMAIKKAIHKYGKENFEINILEECDIENLDDREIFYIQKYDSYNKGYNLTSGGKLSNYGNFKLSESERNGLCELYLSGFSLREVAKEYSVDKKTAKNMLSLNSIQIRDRRIYKYTNELLTEIKKLLDSGVSGKEVCKKYKISKAYASQIKNGSRRI